MKRFLTQGAIMSRTPTVMPILSPGRHRSPRQGACFMEFASFLAGNRWSDHPPCTHPVLAALARDVNDMTSDGARADLMAHVNRVVGLNSEHPLITPTIAMLAGAAAIPVASFERQRALAVGLLTISTHVPELRDEATAALAECPAAERWAQSYLSGSKHLPRMFGRKAAESMVHTAIMGIAFACYPSGESFDDRLVTLLITAIGRVEQLVPDVEHSTGTETAVALVAV